MSRVRRSVAPGTRRLLPIVLFLAALPAAPARSDEPADPAESDDALELSATDKLEYRRLDQDDVREEAFRNRLEVTGHQGIFSAWIRLESLALSNPAVYDPYGFYRAGLATEDPVDQTEVTKRQFAVETEHFRLQAGDVAHVFGRGLALSVFEDEELNHDTRLEGVRTLAEKDELGTATAVAGSSEGNRFRGVFAEPRPFHLVGTRTRFGASFVEAWGAEEHTDILPREQHSDGFAEVTAGPATLYGEYLERKFPGKDGQGVLGTPGHGGFVSAEVTAGGFTVSGEHRDYRRFEHRYHDPPTTLRQHTWTSLNRVIGQVLSDIPDDDANGTLAQAGWAKSEFTVLQGSWAQLDEDLGADKFTEVYGEAKTTWKERLFLTGAAAESELNFGNTTEERISGLGETVVQMDDANSLTLDVEWTEVQTSDESTQAFQNPARFHERIFAGSWGHSPWLSATVTYEDSDEDDPSEPRDNWLNGVVAIAVAEGHDVTLTYGSERGGWKCTGGVCFFEPEFEGFKVKWVGRF